MTWPIRNRYHCSREIYHLHKSRFEAFCCDYRGLVTFIVGFSATLGAVIGLYLLANSEYSAIIGLLDMITGSRYLLAVIAFIFMLGCLLVAAFDIKSY